MTERILQCTDKKYRAEGSAAGVVSYDISNPELREGKVRCTELKAPTSNVETSLRRETAAPVSGFRGDLYRDGIKSK